MDTKLRLVPSNNLSPLMELNYSHSFIAWLRMPLNIQVLSPFFIVCLTFFGNPGSYFDITKDISATYFSLTTIFWSNLKLIPFYFQISFNVAISEFSSDTCLSLVCELKLGN